MTVAENSFPFAGDPSSEDRWRIMFAHLGDGVINDAAGGGLRVTADGSSTTVTVAAGEYRIQSHVLDLTAAKALALGSLGTQPTAGQTRLDRIIVRLDPAAAVGSKVIVTAKTGTPAASGAALQGLTQNATGIWERDVAVVTRAGTAAVTQAGVSDRRTWVGGTLVAAAGYVLGAEPVGTHVRLSGFEWRRVLDVNGSPLWMVDNVSTPTAALVGVYQGTPTRLLTKTGNYLTNGAGDVVLVDGLGEVPGGGVLTCQVAGANSTLNVNAAVRNDQGNCTARLWVNNAVAVNAVVSLTILAVVF